MTYFQQAINFIVRASQWDLSDPESIASLLVAHLYITLLTLVIGLLIAVPVALLIVRYRRLDLPVQTVAGLLYTIPSIAFMAFMIRFTGLELPTILVPLIAYAQVVLIRNIVAAIRAVDPALVEVGRAMGMSRSQVQIRVILPLALPVIVAGIRIVAVTTIGIATLSQLITVPSLGTLIFQGNNLGQPYKIVAGSLLVSALAILVDLSLQAVQRALARGQAAPAGSSGLRLRLRPQL
jgi:osmoprotectant transport system permease protein